MTQQVRHVEESLKDKSFISTIMTQQVRHVEESLKDKSFISTIMAQQVRHTEESMGGEHGFCKENVAFSVLRLAQ